MKNNIDIFFFIILMIVVSAFIGLNIVSIIDKKLSNLSINMPNITIPPAEVILNIENDKNKYKIKCLNNLEKQKNKANDKDDYIEIKPEQYLGDEYKIPIKKLKKKKKLRKLKASNYNEYQE